MKKIWILGLGLALAVCACGNQTQNTQESKEEELVVVNDHSNDGVLRVGISMPSDSLERWKHDGEFLKKHLEEAGYKVDLAFSDNLIDTQINDIEGLIENKADVLLVTAVDGKSLTGVMKKAAEHDIPVIAYDRLIRDTPYVSAYVSYDNYRVGQLQGEYMRDALNLEHAGNKIYHVEFVSGDPADNNSLFFYQGAYDVLEPYMENGTIQVMSGQTDFYTTSTAQWSSINAKSRMDILIGSYYSSGSTLHGVVCANDSTALGTLKALEDSYRYENAVEVTGQDCDVANLQQLMNGTQSMSVYKDLDQEALLAVQLTEAVLLEQSIQADLASTMGIPCIYDDTSYENGIITVPSFLLEPETVTAENAEDILVNKYHSYELGPLGFERVSE